MSTSPFVELDIEAGVAVLSLSSPPANALSLALVENLERGIDEVLTEGATVLVFASRTPRFFAAGADLKLLANASSSEFSEYLVTLRSLIERIASLSQPTIAAIGGMALGGGLELALACTLRTASPQAGLGLPEVKLGLLPGAGGTQRLTRLIGRGPALDLLLTGRSVDGNEALALGLVDQLCSDDLLRETVDLARLLAKQPKQAMEMIIRCVDAAGNGSFVDGMAFEQAAVEGLFDTPDAREGIKAFVEKRQPDFS